MAREQCKQKPVTINTIMRERAFRIGMSHYKKGLSIDAFQTNDGSEEWSYERGRQFAALHPDITVEMVKPEKGAVDVRMQLLLLNAFEDGSIL